MTHLYPLLFEPHLSERPWGGEKLKTMFHKALPPDQRIGESWEIYTSNVIANGRLKGTTLRDALKEFGDEIGPRDGEDFPLLVKILDANEWLSIQVHPDDAKAREIEGQPRGKTECWYVLQAEPGAKISYGTASETTAEDFRAAVASGKAEAAVAYVPVQAGDFIYVPAGTMHALGPGLVIYELQQSSDTTYRVYDWGRVGKDGKPRELHLEKALKVSDFKPVAQPKVAYTAHADPFGNEVAELVRGPFFALDRIRLVEEETKFDTGGVCRLITVIDGAMRINNVVIHKGSSTLIPAGLGEYRVEQNGGAEFLMGWPRTEP